MQLNTKWICCVQQMPYFIEKELHCYVPVVVWWTCSRLCSWCVIMKCSGEKRILQDARLKAKFADYSQLVVHFSRVLIVSFSHRFPAGVDSFEFRHDLALSSCVVLFAQFSSLSWFHFAGFRGFL